jgi:STE24 endopeptidase
MNRRWLFIISACALGALFVTVSRAQSPTASPAITQSASPVTQGMDPAAATKAWLDSVPADKRAKSDAYFEGGYWLVLWNFLLSAGIMLFLLVSKASARLRDFAERMTRFRFLQALLYAVPFLLITILLSFPLTIYADFIRDHAYGLSNQNFSSWLIDQFKPGVVVFIALSILIGVLYIIFRRAPRTWWLWAVAVLVLFNILGTTIAPVYILPLTNKYKPLTDPAIREPILAMARANEIPVNQVYEFDASRQTNRISANVSGFLGTTRIALNDNLLKQCSLPEIRQVMAHEMGHYVLNHSLGLIIFNAILFLIAFAVTRFAFDAIVRRRGERWGVRGISDPAGLPLLVLIFVTVFFLLTPITNSLTRTLEREADAFGINTSREPDGFAKVALKLGSYRKLDPGPLEEMIFFDHPSGRARIRMAMDWKAAKLPAGQSRE